jgi:hypothetical protein
VNELSTSWGRWLQVTPGEMSRVLFLLFIPNHRPDIDSLAAFESQRTRDSTQDLLFKRSFIERSERMGHSPCHGTHPAEQSLRLFGQKFYERHSLRTSMLVLHLLFWGSSHWSPARVAVMLSRVCFLSTRNGDACMHLILAYRPTPIPPFPSLREEFDTIRRFDIAALCLFYSLMSNRPLINNVGRVQNANFGYNSGEVFR